MKTKILCVLLAICMVTSFSQNFLYTAEAAETAKITLSQNNGKISIDLTGADTYGGELLVGFYTDTDELYKVKNFKVYSGITYTLDADKNASQVKVMWIKSIKSLKPICEMSTLKVNKGTSLELDIKLIDEAIDINKGYIEYYDSMDDNTTSKLYIDDTSFDVYVNGFWSYDDFKETFDEYRDLDGYITFTDFNNDLHYDRAEFTVYDYYLVTSVDYERNRIQFNQINVSFNEYLNDEEYCIKFKNAKGDDISIADFEVNDVVAVIAKDTGRLRACRPSYSNNIIIYINLGDNYVEGTVTDYNEEERSVYIDNVKYNVYLDYTIGTEKGYRLGDTGTYYLTLSGKIFGYDSRFNIEYKYAYVLDAYAEDDILNGIKLQVKLLTSDKGIITVDADKTFKYTDTTGKSTTLNSKSNSLSDYKNFTSSYVLTFTDGLLAIEPKSMVTYELNAENKIASITAFKDTVQIDSPQKYYPTYKVIGDQSMYRGAKIFILDSNDIDKSRIVTLSALRDGYLYKGYVAELYDGTYNLAVVTESVEILPDLQPVSIAYKINDTVYEGKDATEVYAYTNNNSDLVRYIFTTDSIVQSTKTVNDLNGGSVFMCKADENGVVKSYSVLGTVENDRLSIDTHGINSTSVIIDNKEYSYAWGYIDKLSYNRITLTNGTSYIIKDTANQYTYDFKDSVVIYVDDCMATITVDNRANDGKANFVFFKLYNYNKVVDVYTFSKQVEIE